MGNRVNVDDLDLKFLKDDELHEAKSHYDPKDRTINLSNLSDKTFDALKASRDAKKIKTLNAPGGENEQMILRNERASKPSQAVSAGRGAASGVLSGFSDELAGVASAMKGLGYDYGRDYARAQESAAKETNPKSYTAGLLGGSAISPLNNAAMGGLGAVKAGMIAGGLQGLGESTAEGNMGNVLETAKGAALGGAFSKAGDVLGGAFSALGGGKKAAVESLRKNAGEQAIKATGAKLADIRALSGEPADAGLAMLDEGLIPLFGNAEDIAEKAAPVAAKYGNQIKSMEEKLAGVKINPERLSKSMQEEIVSPLKASGSYEASTRYAPLAEERASHYAEKAADLDIPALNKVKRDMDKYDIKWNKNQNNLAAPEELTREFRSALNKEAKASIGEKAGSQALADWEKANKGYGAAATALKLGESDADRMLANRTISLSDYLAANAAGNALSEGVKGAERGGLISGVIEAGAAVANKMLRERGNSVAANAYNGMAKLLTKSPQALGKYADVLAKAATAGPVKLAATHAMLMKDPDYSNIVSEEQ